MAQGFNSFDESTIGGFIESPLNARQGDAPNRVVWTTDTNYNRRLSGIDYSVLIPGTNNPLSGAAWGIGGDDTVVWLGGTDGGDPVVAELSVSDLTYVRDSGGLGPYSLTYGTGGDADQIWFCENGGNILSLDPLDFSQKVPPHSTGINDTDGVGGTVDTLWLCASENDHIFKLDVNDYSVDRQTSSPGGTAVEGMGGSDDRAYTVEISPRHNDLWVFDGLLNWVKGPIDLDPSSAGSDIWGIGGT